MNAIIIFTILLCLMLTGMPISISLGLTVLSFLFLFTQVPLEAVALKLFTGIVGGFGRGFSANANSVFSGVTTNADGTRSKLSAGDILGGGLGQGAADAADTVSKYLIERAEQYQPVVEMPTGIDVEIVFLDGVYVRNSQ